MSDLAVGTARIIVRPDASLFRQQLLAEVNKAAQNVSVAVPVTAVTTGTGLAAVAAQTAALTASQEIAAASTAQLTGLAQIENTTFARQAVILQAATVATQEKAGADAAAAAAARTHAVAQGQVEKAAIASAAGMLGLRGAVLTAGTAFIAATVGFQALGRAVQSSIDFERELNVFAVTAGATADQMERVSEVARELGRDITLPGVAANDAAQTLSLLARAGLSVEDALAGVRGTLQLATAAQIENAKAAELVANALNSFKLDGTEAARVADLLAGAAAQSQGSIEDMGLALRQTSAIAAGLGISVEDTVTILTQLARAGLSASDAGTSFRQTLLRLIQDLPKVTKEVDRLGLDLRDMSGNIRPEVFEELGRKLQKLTPQARQLAIANLGGADAIRTLLILTRAQAGEFDDVSEAITRAGIAQEQAAARTQGLGGDVEAAKNQFADLGLTVGNLVSGPLSLFVRTAGEAAGAVNDVTNELREADQGFGETFGNFINRFSESFARLNFNFQQGVRAGLATSNTFTVLSRTAREATTAVEDLAAALQKAASNTAATQGTPQGGGLGVQQILNRVQGFDAEEVRARISGDNSALLAVLQSEQDFLLAQLERQFVRNRPALRRQLELALLGVTNDIASISRQGATESKNAAEDALRSKREADQALLDLFSNQRQDVAIQAAGAAAEDNIRRQIRLANQLQALIKQQIADIRKQVALENGRKEAIRQLRIALIESRREEEALRQERAQQALANRQEGVELDIDLAVTTNNISREIAARQRLIALLKKQQANVKKGTNEWKRLRNEIAEQQQAIKDARGEAEQGSDQGRTAQQFFFEQLQAQQGFASNLLGNLITGPTAGLVGVPSPTPGTTGAGAGIAAAAALQAGKEQGGPTAGQASTTNVLLERILRALIDLNRNADTPEAVQNKRAGSALMDGIGGGSGSASVM